MPSSYYVGGIIQILHFISEELLQCDTETTIAELFSDEFDDLDFELALTCFEATYKVAFAETFWKTEIDEYEDKTIRSVTFEVKIEDIIKRERLPVSIMPEGLVTRLSDEE
ncbi:MAG: hypothetical protein ABMA01_20210, partial [Chthoniobacteraceae bacterium]